MWVPAYHAGKQPWPNMQGQDPLGQGEKSLCGPFLQSWDMCSFWDTVEKVWDQCSQDPCKLGLQWLSYAYLLGEGWTEEQAVWPWGTLAYLSR